MGTLKTPSGNYTLWEMADEGAGSYSEDPLIHFDITVTILNGLTAGGVQTYLAFYTGTG